FQPVNTPHGSNPTVVSSCGSIPDCSQDTRFSSKHAVPADRASRWDVSRDRRRNSSHSSQRKLRQAVSLPAQKRPERELVVEAAECADVRSPASKSFNIDAEIEVTGNPGQLPRKVR